MPGTRAGFLRDLIEMAERTQFDTVLPVPPGGRPQPLCGVYHVRALPALEAAFAGGVRKVVTALEGVRMLAHPVMETIHFQNVNTPEEWAAYVSD